MTHEETDEERLFDLSTETVNSLMESIAWCADRARSVGSGSEATAYALAARALGEALAFHGEWSRPANSRR